MRFNILSFLFQFIVFSSLGQSGDFPLGYGQKEDTTTFYFSTSDYNLAPTRVSVTGAFRNWDTNMDDPKWLLRKESEILWSLKVFNPKLSVIPVSCPFKFRIDSGKWLDPPAKAQNVEGGNLIFMRGFQAPTLKAEIHRSKTIWAWVGGHGLTRPFDKSAYKLKDAKGNEIPIASVLPNDSSKTLITPAIEFKSFLLLRRLDAGFAFR
jgi:hypothetical protein